MRYTKITNHFKNIYFLAALKPRFSTICDVIRYNGICIKYISIPRNNMYTPLYRDFRAAVVFKVNR